MAGNGVGRGRTEWKSVHRRDHGGASSRGEGGRSKRPRTTGLDPAQPVFGPAAVGDARATRGDRVTGALRGAPVSDHVQDVLDLFGAPDPLPREPLPASIRSRPRAVTWTRCEPPGVKWRDAITACYSSDIPGSRCRLIFTTPEECS